MGSAAPSNRFTVQNSAKAAKPKGADEIYAALKAEAKALNEREEAIIGHEIELKHRGAELTKREAKIWDREWESTKRYYDMAKRQAALLKREHNLKKLENLGSTQHDSLLGAALDQVQGGHQLEAGFPQGPSMYLPFGEMVGAHPLTKFTGFTTYGLDPYNVPSYASFRFPPHRCFDNHSTPSAPALPGMHMSTQSTSAKTTMAASPRAPASIQAHVAHPVAGSQPTAKNSIAAETALSRPTTGDFITADCSLPVPNYKSISTPHSGFPAGLYPVVNNDLSDLQGRDCAASSGSGSAYDASTINAPGNGGS